MRTLLMFPIVLGVGLLGSLGSGSLHVEISTAPAQSNLRFAPAVDPVPVCGDQESACPIRSDEVTPQNEGCSSACAGDKDEQCCYLQCVCASDPDDRAKERACRAYDKMHCSTKR